MEAISDESSFSRNSREENEGRYGGGNLILWIAAIAVLIGLNFASWSFCMWVFGQPEHPMNYRLLVRLDKLDPIHGFTAARAPRGKFYSAKDLYALVYPFDGTQLKAYSGIQKRHFLKNYVERDDVVFLSGEFAVESVQWMGEEDVFRGGVVIRGRSTTFPDAYVDFALPSVEPPESFDLDEGTVIRIEEATMCAALLNVDRQEDARMVFSVVPLVTKVDSASGESTAKTYEFGENAKITVNLPERIRIEPERWPISEDEPEEIQEKPVGLSGKGAEAAGEKDKDKDKE